MSKGAVVWRGPIEVNWQQLQLNCIVHKRAKEPESWV